MATGLFMWVLYTCILESSAKLVWYFGSSCRYKKKMYCIVSIESIPNFYTAVQLIDVSLQIQCKRISPLSLLTRLNRDTRCFQLYLVFSTQFAFPIQPMEKIWQIYVSHEHCARLFVCCALLCSVATHNSVPIFIWSTIYILHRNLFFPSNCS